MSENEEFIAQCLQDALVALQANKPVSAGPMARRYAIVITMLEQAIAYFYMYVMGENDAN